VLNRYRFKVEQSRAGLAPWTLQPSTFDVQLFLGFVPDSAKDQSFVINQIGGFVLQKLSAFSRQPSGEVERLMVQGRRAKNRSLGLDSSTFNIRPSTLLSSPNGGFVPDFSTARSFIIKQIGGFVFKKAISFQPSASGYQQDRQARSLSADG